MDLEQLFDAEEYLYFLAQALSDEDTAQQIAFIETTLAMQPPMRVLDVGCGHGRHANELARRGYRVTGVDLVEGFLAVARRDATAEYVRADIAELAYDGVFDRAICLFDVLGYEDDDHARRTLAGIHRALVSGGRLLLDLRSREWIARLPPSAVLDLPNGDLMIDRYRFDPDAGRLFDRRTYLRDGVRRDIEFSVRVWTLLEIKRLVADAGFTITSAFGGFDGAAVASDRHRVVVACER